METPAIYSATLGLSPPWFISSVNFSREEQRLDITVDFVSEKCVNCPACGQERNICEKARETWRHDNFFNYRTYLHVRVPGTECVLCGDPELERPWLRQGSKFVRVE